jgi:hypothetical protein
MSWLAFIYDMARYLSKRDAAYELMSASTPIATTTARCCNMLGRANFRSRGLIRYAETSSESLFAGLSTAWSCAALDAALRCLGVFEIDFPYVNQFTLDACELAYTGLGFLGASR